MAEDTKLANGLEEEDLLELEIEELSGVAGGGGKSSKEAPRTDHNCTRRCSRTCGSSRGCAQTSNACPRSYRCQTRSCDLWTTRGCSGGTRRCHKKKSKGR